MQGTLSLEIKQLVWEIDHPLLSSAEVKNVWSYTYTPQYIFMVWCLSQDNVHFITHLLYEIT